MIMIKKITSDDIYFYYDRTFIVPLNSVSDNIEKDKDQIVKTNLFHQIS